MSVPVDIADVDTITASNSPAGTDAIGTSLDDYIRAHAAFIAQLRNGSKNLTDGSAAAASSARLSDPNTGMYFPAADYVALTGGGAVWGNYLGVWQNASQTQPSFRSTVSANRTTSGVFDTYTIAYDQNGSGFFNDSTGVFTAPCTGIYLFNVNAYFSSAGGASGSFTLAKNGTPSQYDMYITFGSSVTDYKCASNTMQLAAGDTVSVYGGIGGTATCHVDMFSGHLLG